MTMPIEEQIEVRKDLYATIIAAMTEAKGLKTETAADGVLVFLNDSGDKLAKVRVSICSDSLEDERKKKEAKDAMRAERIAKKKLEQEQK